MVEYVGCRLWHPSLLTWVSRNQIIDPITGVSCALAYRMNFAQRKQYAVDDAPLFSHVCTRDRSASQVQLLELLVVDAKTTKLTTRA